MSTADLATEAMGVLSADECALCEKPVVDELIFRGYAHNRMTAPHIPVSVFAKHFKNAEALEARYQAMVAKLGGK